MLHRQWEPILDPQESDFIFEVQNTLRVIQVNLDEGVDGAEDTKEDEDNDEDDGESNTDEEGEDDDKRDVVSQKSSTVWTDLKKFFN